MAVLAAGTLALDDVVTDEGSVSGVPGGSALYFTAAASLFTAVRLVGIIGDDFPREELDFLRERSVNLDNLTQLQGEKTFRWGARYETDMNVRRTFRREINVSKRFDPILDDIGRNADIVFLANLEPAHQLRVLDQLAAPRFRALDTMECYIRDDPDGLKKVMERCELLFVNDAEARIITGEVNLLKVARKLLGMGPRYVLLKKGDHGSMLVAPDFTFTAPAYPVETVVDPTGAGDSFAGGVMGYLARKESCGPDDLKKAVIYGSVAASFCVEDFSIRKLKKITLANIEARMAQFRSMTTW